MKNIKKTVRQVHKWTGLILGIQVLFWVAGGVVMSWIPLEIVRGEDLANKAKPGIIQAADFKGSTAEIIASYPEVISVASSSLLGAAAYLLKFNDDKVILLDAQTLQPITPINQRQAKKIALDDYKGQGSIEQTIKLPQGEGESRGRTGPLWQINFADGRDTHIYVSAQSGKVVARRNSYWRLFDFVWMLHIMEYDTRDNFNNWLLRIFAGSGLLFVFSGIWLYFYSFRKHDFSWLLSKKKH